MRQHFVLLSASSVKKKERTPFVGFLSLRNVFVDKREGALRVIDAAVFGFAAPDVRE